MFSFVFNPPGFLVTCARAPSPFLCLQWESLFGPVARCLLRPSRKQWQAAFETAMEEVYSQDRAIQENATFHIRYLRHDRKCYLECRERIKAEWRKHRPDYVQHPLLQEAGHALCLLRHDNDWLRGEGLHHHYRELMEKPKDPRNRTK